ncbi:MAG: hypothetical protein JW807_08615 [Spirochaetes bacterium]|nr:hypothetical protein [Spirochaetota bacterium]
MGNGKELGLVKGQAAVAHYSPHGEDDTVNVDAPQRGSIVKEVLATPFVKEMIRESLNSARASSSPGMMRHFMWQDMDFFFSIVASLPLLVNSIFSALAELGSQLDDKIGPGMLKDYIGEMADDFNINEISRTLEVYGRIVTRLMEHDDVREAVMNSVRDTLAASLGRGVNTSMKAVNRAQEHDPAFIGGTIDSITRGIDGNEAGRALMEIVNAALDRVSFTKIAWRFIAGRIKHKFRRKKYKSPSRA